MANESGQPSSGSGGKSWALTSEEVKDQVWRGLIDIKNVFLFPLCSGIMTGVGFIAGKKLAEGYFYGGSVAKSSTN